MKKFGKIFALLLTLAILAAAFALIVSADYSDASFIVNGKASEKTTLADAITEAGDGGTVKLNKDVTIDATVDISSDIKLDMNGHTIESVDNATDGVRYRHFNVKGGKFEVCGEGSFIGSLYVAQIYSGAELTVNAYGSGINIDAMKSKSSNFNPFYVMPGGSMTVKGTLNINPYYPSENAMFIVGDVDTAELTQETSTLILDGARITVNEPDAKYKYQRQNFAYFLQARDGADVTLKNHSVVNMVNGNGIKLSSYHGGSMLSGTGSAGKLTALDSGKTIKDFRIFLDIDDSEIIAGNSGYQRKMDSSGYSTSAGYLFVLNAAPAKITVDNSTLSGANRTIGGKYTAYDKYEMPLTYLYFKNVNFRTNDNPLYSSGWIVSYRNNIIWDGGVIDLYNTVQTVMGSFVASKQYTDPFSAEAKAEALAAGLTVTDDLYVSEAVSEGVYTYTYYKHTRSAYSEIANACLAYAKLDTNGDGDITDAEDWNGVLFKDVYFASRAPISPAADVETKAKACFSYEGSLKNGVYKIDDTFSASAKYYAAAYVSSNSTLSEATPLGNSVDAHLSSKYTSVFNPTLAYKRDFATGTAVVTGVNTVTPIVVSAKNYGVYEIVPSVDGSNGYYKFSVPQGHTDSTSRPYIEVDVGNYATGITVTEKNDGSGSVSISPNNAATHSLEDYKYLVQEFDVATDTGIFAFLKAAPIFRYMDLSVSGSTYSRTDSAQPQYSFCPLSMPTSGKLNAWSNTTNLICEKNSNTIYLATDGSWNRITVIIELLGWGEYEKYTLGTDTNRERAVFNANMHIYVNGEWYTTFKGIFDGSKKIDKEMSGTLVYDAFRLNSGDSTANSSTLFDNMRVSFYEENDALAAQMKNYKGSIKENPELMLMPRNENIVGTVDGTICYSDEDIANRVENGSYVELFRDLESDISAENKNLTFKLNGNSVEGIVSATHKVVNYEDVISVVPAGNDLYEITYVNNDVTPAISKTVYAGLGTKAVLDIDLSEYNDCYNVGGKMFYFDGWSLVDGGEEDTYVSTDKDADGDKKITAYSIYVEAATVEWYDNDSNLLNTEYYRAGEDVYSAVYEPTVEIPNIVTDHAWYDLGFADYSAIALPEPGTYKVYPNMKGVNKEGTPDNIKLNLTLFTNNELNIFIPLEYLDAYKESIRIVRLDGETNTIAVGSIGEYTVYAEPYMKFADVYGIADTSINTYRIYYTVGETELYKDISYGVPAYASQIMQQSSDEEAKTLVMYMVNYANAVIKNLNVDKTGDMGARVYTKLLELYPDYVSIQADSEFLEGGTIYNNDVAKLTYDDVILNEDETVSDRSPSKWIAGGGFFFSTNQPRFYIKFTDEAEQTANGIKKPDTAGGYGWSGTGLFAYVGVQGETIRPGKLYARYDESGLDAYAEWNSKKDGITYYVAATSYDAQNPFKLYNMAEPLNIKLNSHSGSNTGIVYYPEQGDAIIVTYSLAGYINGMLTAANAEGVSAEDKAEYLAAAEMAKALYAYAKVTREFVY